MEEPTSTQVEPDKPPVDVDPILPFGVMAAILFVRGFMVVTFFPTVAVVVATLIHLTHGPFSNRNIVDALIESVALVIASVLFSLMLAGGAWFDAILSQRSSSRAAKRVAQPARGFFMPVLAGVSIYAGLATLLWVLSLMETNIAKSWPWPLVWGIIGGSALFLYRHLDRSLPREQGSEL